MVGEGGGGWRVAVCRGILSEVHTGGLYISLLGSCAQLADWVIYLAGSCAQLAGSCLKLAGQFKEINGGKVQEN